MNAWKELDKKRLDKYTFIFMYKMKNTILSKRRKGKFMYYPYVVAGAGLAGLTVAERIANEKGEKVLIVEKRSSYFPYKRQGSLLLSGAVYQVE